MLVFGNNEETGPAGCSLWSRVAHDWMRRRRGTPALAVKAVDTSLLAGNWLLTESMPSNSFIAGQPNPFRLAVNFDVSGNVISAAGFGNDSCTNGSYGVLFSSLSATGTVGADGSFAVQTPGNFIEATSQQGGMRRARW